MVECGRCKQWISGDSLDLDREKIKEMNFTCRACVEGDSWRKKLGSGRKRQRRGQIRKEGRKNRRVRRMEKRDGEKNGRVGNKYKGWKRE